MTNWRKVKAARDFQVSPPKTSTPTRLACRAESESADDKNTTNKQVLPLLIGMSKTLLELSLPHKQRQLSHGFHTTQPSPLVCCSRSCRCEYMWGKPRTIHLCACHDLFGCFLRLLLLLSAQIKVRQLWESFKTGSNPMAVCVVQITRET